MRELAVFYCPKCGHYAYYQTSRHPQCPKCGCEEAMYMVRMHYTEFMRMSCDERDEFLSKEILKTTPSLVERLTAPHKRYNSREIIAEMNNVIMNLDTENKILSDTVKWMHDTIWELMHEKRESAQGKVSACGGCQNRKLSEECMEETVETAQVQRDAAHIKTAQEEAAQHRTSQEEAAQKEAAYREAAAADMSQTTETEKEQEI